MSLIRNLFFVLLALTFFLKVADIVFSFFYVKDYLVTSVNRGTVRSIVLREFNPNQSAIVNSSIEHIKGAESSEMINFSINIDSNGFIDNGNSISQNPDIRIIFFGGSTTESLYVSEKNRFPSIIERTLREDLNLDVQIHNAGVSGNNSMHSNLSLIAKGIPLNPNFAILMHNINDFSVLAKTQNYWVAPSTRSLISESNNYSNKSIYALKSIKDILFPNLYSYLKPRLLLLKVSQNDEFNNHRKDFNTKQHNEIEAQFKSSLLTFIEISNSWGITPILMTQFNRVSLTDPAFKAFFDNFDNIGMTPETYIKTYKKFNEIIREVAKEKNISLIDLDKLIPAKHEYIFDIVHLNDQGSIYTANIISDHLKEIIN